MPHFENEPTIAVDDTFGDWRDTLIEDGFVVLKGVLSQGKAQSYVVRMYKWLESFPFGFKRDDPSTWKPQCLPNNMKGGMYHDYAVQHEKFMWDARCEPSVVEPFQKLWGTEDLLVSFDGMNLTFPVNPRPTSAPWPHVDQSPLRKGMQCVQGILNLAPNGPKDGGLVVLKKSSKLNELFFKTHTMKEGSTWSPADWYGFSQEDVEWFQAKGCEMVKVCADPGDLVLWDSRTVHYNVLPETDNTRAVMYICYSPARFASEEDLQEKATLFHERTGTTHWPHANIFRAGEKHPERTAGEPYGRNRPVEEPEEPEILLKLAGALSY
ncbi:hypothetical protein M409DRAFT_71081 [Zasmidium cellare ATCC 36951]|uniref:Phytanoyl-CoA dioxygenase n=1 Tax=Zasmidium cellare ATCC 36951 TaxID=1080233 RepID=A0A6A6C0R8_ZASCE|nr:uncharacterized protein M409DRAFT_71081 [Zasmidium cellare ATCC 36951]KAF2159296.1 hypothetical protein M409DRAFT_71081 [Zasmidium cellare ATCC 36951]